MLEYFENLENFENYCFVYILLTTGGNFKV